MEILGIGPLELLFILLIALIVIGPKDMVKTGRNLGKMLRKVVTSSQWQTLTRTSREIRNIPNRLIREAGLEEMQQELNGLKKTTMDIQNTLRESTQVPADWLGTNKTIGAGKNPQGSNSAVKPDNGSPVMIATPEDELFSGTTDPPAITDDSKRSESLVTASIDISSWITELNDFDPSEFNDQDDGKVDLSTWITPPAHHHKKPTHP